MIAQERDRPDDAQYCARITRRHARTFFLASRLLPAAKRRAAYALYAFCRVADDLVDEAGTTGVAEQRRRLEGYRGKLQDAMAGRASGAVFREVARVSRQYEVPVSPLLELLDGVARDLEESRYADWDSLERYCQGVASSVGEMCTFVFGVEGGAEGLHRAVPYARTLGVAMQLTNILRDVGEDARRGRCYLPEDELAQHGLTARDVLLNRDLPRDPRWAAFMRGQVARARSLYRAASPGIAMLAPDARRCAAACATGYAGILTAIEALDYDTISTRARLGRVARLGVLWDAWRYRTDPPHAAAAIDTPGVRHTGLRNVHDAPAHPA
jgi:15-cis-phytoene synthase